MSASKNDESWRFMAVHFGCFGWSQYGLGVSRHRRLPKDSSQGLSKELHCFVVVQHTLFAQGVSKEGQVGACILGSGDLQTCKLRTNRRPTS